MALGVGLAVATRAVLAGDAPPAVGRPAPAFTLPDADGNKKPLSAFKGKRIALFFFCGCSWCADVGKEWGELQAGGALSEKEPAPPPPKGGKPPTAKPVPARETPPVTVIVYSEMSAESAKTLAASCGLDPAQTVLLVDEDRRVTADVYYAEPCPRAFVLDAAGIVRYTNNSAIDAPRKAPAAAIVARTLDALRKAAGAPAPPAGKGDKKPRPERPAAPAHNGEQPPSGARSVRASQSIQTSGLAEGNVTPRARACFTHSLTI